MKTSPNFSVKVSRSAGEIDKNEWDSIFPDIPESYGFFKTIDETMSGQFIPYYILIYDEAGVACVAPCFAFDYPLDTTIDGPLKRFISSFRKIMPGLLVPRAFMCGSPASEGRIGIKNAPYRDDIIKTLVREMRRLAEKERASFIAFKEFSGDYADTLKPLLNMKFHMVRALPSVEMDLPFKSFEEYFNTLSAATRIDLRRKFKKTDGRVKIEMEVRSELGDLLDEAYGLYTDTLRKSNMKFEVMPKSFFRDIPQNMPGVAKFFLWRVEGKLVAFHLCLVSGGVFIAEYLGFDYDIAYDYHLYFIHFRDEMKWCIRNGVRRYESGAMNYDPKKRLDFRFVPQYIYARHKNPTVNFLFGPLIKLLDPVNSDPVLKSMKY